MRHIYLLSLIFVIYFVSCSKDKSIADPCANVICQNGGICDNGECICANGFIGLYCDSSTLNPCDTVTCYNGGNCVDGSCRCYGDFYGNQCQYYYSSDSFFCATDYPYQPSDCPTGLIGPTCTSYIHDVIVGTFTENVTYDNTSIFDSAYIAFALAGSNNNEFYLQIPSYSNDLILIERNVLDLTIPTQNYAGLSISGSGSLIITNMSVYIYVLVNDGTQTNKANFRMEAYIQ